MSKSKNQSIYQLNVPSKNYLVFVMIALVIAITGFSSSSAYARLSGAIFTTLEDGSRVNANIYETIEDVYLDGGPGQNAPSGAAGLPEGYYYFQVTDPSGKVLLSTDPVKCRCFHVNGKGVIDSVCPAAYAQKIRGKLSQVNCTHITGVDIDHSDEGAITVQLMPYQKTPNKGGVYKVWATKAEMFVGDIDKVDNPQYFHGFVPAWSKTDNYKVRRGQPCESVINISKFDDSDANCVRDEYEEELGCWPVDVTDPLSVTNRYYTPVCIDAQPPGLWTICEQIPEGWMQTCLMIDGNSGPALPCGQVEVLGSCNEVHSVVFGNIRLGEITACKFYDRNANGIDNNEPPVAGIWFVLDGNDIMANRIHQEKYTGQCGCVTFGRLLPGDYKLCEVLSAGSWSATTDVCIDIKLLEGEKIVYKFGNVCRGKADFDTKGYWHNKNGLSETLNSDFVYLNSLLPWQSPSSYFDAGDEPIDGLFSDGSPVPEAKNAAGEWIAPAGSAWAEQSFFLVDKNAGGDPREQLAQQLDAFIMNVRHRTGGNTLIKIPDGSWIDTLNLIDRAINAWQNGNSAQQLAYSGILDILNNSDSVEFVYSQPCLVVYP